MMGTRSHARAELRRPASAVLLAALCACGGHREDAVSVVLIAIDTLRADHLGAYGHPRATSPELDRWAARGALFERALASSPWTLPSFASIYTGQPPSRHAAGLMIDRESRPMKCGRLDASVPTLPEILRDHGYATHALVTNPWLHDGMGVTRGFESYDAADVEVRMRRAGKTVTQSLRWLDRHGEGPFFLLVHFMDPHLAYDPPARLRGRFTGSYAGPLDYPVKGNLAIRARLPGLDEADRRFIAAAYDEELLALDRQLGRLLEGIEERGLLGRALVVLTADHGEELFDHGGFEHGHTVYQELLHVPLVFWGPGVPPGRHPEPVSHVDLLPTLLEALELPVPGGIAGLSLWPALTRGAHLPERGLLAEGTLYGAELKALIRWPWKVIASEGDEAPKLFHLGRDPRERRDLARARTEELGRLLAELRTLSEGPRGRPPPAVAIDEATRGRLRELGYLD
jgi:arylsulfatase A-like enzyme